MSQRAHFGNREVSEAEKSRLVGEVFQSVAGKYDLMNDLMSLGAHRWWKQFAAARAGVTKGDRVLDVAAGSGDLCKLLAGRVGGGGFVVMSDLSDAMLKRGRGRMLDAGLAGNIAFVRADAEQLAFPDNTFDCVSIAFGLRNVTRIPAALASMRRVLRPGGRLLVLEFSRPRSPLLEKIYDAYSFSIIPQLGALVAGDRGSYRYLVESIRKHPPQEELRAMIAAAGFERVEVYNLAGGIVAVHVGCKF